MNNIAEQNQPLKRLVVGDQCKFAGWLAGVLPPRPRNIDITDLLLAVAADWEFWSREE